MATFKEIKEYDIDLVVTGTYGHLHFRELISSGVTEPLVRGSPVSVTAVR